jgi:hypothetical protein
VEVLLLDLSATGARIEHSEPLRPGFACAFEFPPTLGSLVLSGRVVRSSMIGSEVVAEGGPPVRYESGLMFEDVTADQRVALAAILERLRPGTGPANHRQPH